MRARFNLKKFVRKHNSLLTYVGALIVFLTFVVKEGFKDSWEQRAASIEKAEYIKTLLESEQDSKRDMQSALQKLNEQAQTLQTLHFQVIAVQRHVHFESFRPGLKDKASCYIDQQGFDCESEVLQDDNLKKNQGWLKEICEETMRSAWELQAQYDDLGLLADKLPEGNEGRKRWQLAHDEVIKLMDDYDRSHEATSKIALHCGSVPSDGDGDCSYQNFETVRNNLERLIDRSIPLATEADTIYEQLWKSSRTELEKDRKWSERASRGGWLLFALGWGLGLVGKVYGVSEENGAE